MINLKGNFSFSGGKRITGRELLPAIYPILAAIMFCTAKVLPIVVGLRSAIAGQCRYWPLLTTLTSTRQYTKVLSCIVVHSMMKYITDHDWWEILYGKGYIEYLFIFCLDILKMLPKCFISFNIFTCKLSVLISSISFVLQC